MTNVFHDVRYPFSLALGASGGPVRRTEIVPLVSGHEERNSPWAQSRRRWNAAPGIRSRSDVETLIAFFEARHGQLHGFRFRYEDAAGAYDRPIRKPAAASVLVAIDGVAQAEGTDFTVDTATGEVSFAAAPAAGTMLTAGYEFDVPVRFDTDRLDISLDAIEAGEIADLPIIEIRA